MIVSHGSWIYIYRSNYFLPPKIFVSSIPVYDEVYSIQPYVIEYFEDTKEIIRSL